MQLDERQILAASKELWTSQLGLTVSPPSGADDDEPRWHEAA